MIKIYLGNDKYEYTLSSGKVITLYDYEVEELTEYVKVKDEELEDTRNSNLLLKRKLNKIKNILGE